MMNGQFNSMQNPYMTQPYYANRNNPLVQNQNNRIVWVNGIEGAKAYQIEPNSNILLLDSDIEGRMYIKTCDNIGMCNLRIFSYQELLKKYKSNYILNNPIKLYEMQEQKLDVLYDRLNNSIKTKLDNYIHIYLVIKVYVSLHDCLSMEKYVDIKKVYHREIIANILIVKPFCFVKVQDF